MLVQRTRPTVPGRMSVRRSTVTISSRVLEKCCCTCEVYPTHVKNALANLPGVLDVSVSCADSNATVAFDDSDPPSCALLVNAVQSTG